MKNASRSSKSIKALRLLLSHLNIDIFIVLYHFGFTESRKKCRPENNFFSLAISFFLTFLLLLFFESQLKIFGFLHQIFKMLAVGAKNLIDRISALLFLSHGFFQGRQRFESILAYGLDDLPFLFEDFHHLVE